MQDSNFAGALDRKSAADYLSISLRTLDKLLSRNVIPKLKHGRKTLIRKVDIDNYLEQLVVEYKEKQNAST